MSSLAGGGVFFFFFFFLTKLGHKGLAFRSPPCSRGLKQATLEESAWLVTSSRRKDKVYANSVELDSEKASQVSQD